MGWLVAGIALVGGLAVLVVSADRFVVAAELLALRRRWPPALIGAVVVGFGTSLPELVTSVVAAWARQPDLAIGNAAGSNVANLTLVLGLAVLARPLVHAARRGAYGGGLASAAGVLLLALSLDGSLGVIDGVVLVVALGLAVAWQVTRAGGARLEVPVQVPRRGGPRAAAVGALALVGVLGGAQALVWGATELATRVGVPTIVVGSVLVAVGTSLPELATAIASARRGQADLLLGNLFGSNAFNALGVVGASALVGAARGARLDVTTAAAAVVVAGAAVTLGLALLLRWRPALGRLGGALLVAGYLAAVPVLVALS